MNEVDFSPIKDELHTIGDYLRFATSEFNQAELFFGHGTNNAWHEAITLVMFALNLPVELNEQVFNCRLTSAEKSAVLALIERRIVEQLPAAYLTNHAQFVGLPFYVDERVLVPRSPIGELIEQHFSPHFSSDNPPKRILDLCTGSGCIAIACAVAFPEAEVDALDLSIDALNVAQINIENHGLTEQVIPIQSDVFSGVEGLSYDLIVTNPPYVDQEDVDALPQEYLHEPEMGLGSGVDGLDIVREILAQAASYLNENGVLICEVGNSQIHVEHVYPHVPFTWLTFKNGGHGVFMLTKQQLTKHQNSFTQAFEQK
ncbi:50S ribosomal protein L3 N(5)-glutamine methyltransferase [Colwellia hornerae]|uniref:Ribosomal protein uL3 glutamine methyltransferase n=1 Tax=Colwellia hornerae TaxID=89402 RepID=A0A5C6QPK5_9GAMM|nr:50S ribosomal protein L3 N(5)-glutamine methyltransferase [Colwellia hornerae]TWX56317.1 50S ribosomal protein L3 N(5)-glutamine methyltransferase [Colwellia hornerae]TWX62168.1 50S ribosomal protein L3 N(5)-glutamine methyltransferase [Colwellia hornerae]TWX70570.1 50S ribosomal protein L3 N(5)-glutamine methyltransferase [Colwellia hornerae]